MARTPWTVTTGARARWGSSGRPTRLRSRRSSSGSGGRWTWASTSPHGPTGTKFPLRTRSPTPGAAAVEAFEQWLGRPVDVVVDFSARANWYDISAPDYLLDAWRDTGQT